MKTDFPLASQGKLSTHQRPYFALLCSASIYFGCSPMPCWTKTPIKYVRAEKIISVCCVATLSHGLINRGASRK
jgi:hypothetical protein